MSDLSTQFSKLFEIANKYPLLEKRVAELEKRQESPTDVLDIPQIKKILLIGDNAVRKLIKDGQLPRCGEGRKHRVLRAAVEAYKQLMARGEA
jgi:hypothetical protein